MKNKNFIFFIVLIVFLIFLKSDFRIINDLQCCNDDFDYFAHASTIAEDFDFDYSNQLPDKSRYYRNNKNAPFGFVGTGLLSSPFILLGNFMDNLSEFEGNSQLSFKKLFYSFSSIFYFLLSLLLLRKIQQFYKVKFNYLLYFLGSGITYYVFERFSMTPIYEVFTILCLIYLTQQFINNPQNRKLYSFLIPLSLLFSILVRWTNLYVFLIPIIVLLSYKDFKPDLFKKLFNIYFFISSVLSFLIFIFLSKQIYGVLTFSPSYVYMVDEFDALLSDSILKNFINFILEFLKDFIVINFSQEFGLFWFSPIIFISIFLIIYRIIFYKNSKNFLLYFFLLISFLQNFFIVSIWNSTASSYGYRYLFSLIPLSFLVIFINNELLNKKLTVRYLKYFSIFAFISTLFFDSTQFTTLSLEPVLNSFGYEKVYSQPKYLEGVVKSIFEFEAYKKIFATSFLFLFIIELFINQFKIELLYQYVFENSIQNSDLNDLLNKVDELSVAYFIMTLIMALIFSVQILKHVKVENKS